MFLCILYATKPQRGAARHGYYMCPCSSLHRSRFRAGFVCLIVCAVCALLCGWQKRKIWLNKAICAVVRLYNTYLIYIKVNKIQKHIYVHKYVCVVDFLILTAQTAQPYFKPYFCCAVFSFCLFCTAQN